MNRPALEALRAEITDTRHLVSASPLRPYLVALLDALLAPLAPVACGACGEPAGGGHVCGAHARARGAQQARLDAALAAAGGDGMTDADLARWEGLSQDYWWAGRNLTVPEYEVMPTVIPALIAEVRRLRAFVATVAIDCCEDDGARCESDSGPYCSTHGFCGHPDDAKAILATT